MVSFYLDINVVVVWVNRPPSLESFHVSASFPSFQRSLKNKYQNSSVSHLQIFERQQKSAKSHLFAWQYQTFESPKITTSNYPFFFASQKEFFHVHVEHSNWYQKTTTSKCPSLQIKWSHSNHMLSIKINTFWRK